MGLISSKDGSYVGESLEDAVGVVRAESRKAAQKIARASARNWREVTVRNTPIERFLKSATTKPPYHLRNSWQLKRLKVIHLADDMRIYETGIYSEVEYAPYVEEGTGLWGPEHAPYRIRPKRPGGWLSWIARDYHRRKDGSWVKPGQRVFAKEVLHKGSPGQHMVAIGGEMTEAEFEAIARPILAEWAEKSERGMA